MQIPCFPSNVLRHQYLSKLLEWLQGRAMTEKTLNRVSSGRSWQDGWDGGLRRGDTRNGWRPGEDKTKGLAFLKILKRELSNVNVCFLLWNKYSLEKLVFWSCKQFPGSQEGELASPEGWLFTCSRESLGDDTCNKPIPAYSWFLWKLVNV